MICALRQGGAMLALALAAPIAAASPEQARVNAVIAQTKADMLKDAQGAAARARRGEALAATIPDSKERERSVATLLWLQAEAYYRVNNAERAAPLIARALALARKAAPRSKLLGDALLTSASINGDRTEVATALAEFQEAHRIFVQAGEKRSEAIALICLAILYQNGKDFDGALRYLDDALDAYPADAGLAFAIYNTRGLIYQEQGRYNRAQAAFRQAYEEARKANATSLAGRYLRNVARSQLLAGELAEAESTLVSARAMPSTSPDDVRQLDAVAAQAALQHGRGQNAGRLIDRAFAGVDLAETDVTLRDAHRTAVAVYQAQRRPEQALAHLQALKRLDDQATRLATQTGTALMAARFNSANQEAKIARLRDAERLRQAREEVERARNERTLWLGGTGAAAIIIVLLLIGIQAVRRSRDQTRAANDDLAVTNTALGKALAAKTEFLATTSHEIRTPLNGILGMTQVMLADGALPTAARDRLNVVHGAGLTMRALVDDILDVAKMETGNLGLETAPFGLKAMLEDAVRLWVEQARDKGLAFIIDLEGCPRQVEGDVARVRQIVCNILSNAAKFTAAGSITIRAEADEAGVRITIADTGIGIAAEQHEAVFESFRQADTSTTRKFGGTGLGLAICRNLARAMGGDVTLMSRPGEGSTFVIALPLPVLAAPEPAQETTAGDTLLIVDRNPIARAMLRTLFAPHVGTMVFAGTADEAAKLLAGGEVARVVIDDATAKASGDAPAFIAEVVGHAGGAVVAVLWPVAAEQERAVLMALGVTQVIPKPITGAALCAAVLQDSAAPADVSSLVSQAA